MSQKVRRFNITIKYYFKLHIEKQQEIVSQPTYQINLFISDKRNI